MKIRALGLMVGAVSCTFACGAPVEDEAAELQPAEAVGEASEALVSRSIVQTSIHSEEVLEAGDKFGSALASGDFNNDGFQDLVITAPSQDRDVDDAGWVGVMYGGPGGPGSRGTEYFTHNSIDGISRHRGDWLGIAAAAGDFDGDGDDDLAVSIPNYPDGGVAKSGLVAILNGSTHGLLPANTRILTQGLDPDSASEENDQFGWSLAVGRFDNDRFDDLAVGVPGESLGGLAATGRVAVYHGRSSGLDPRVAESISEASVTGLTREAGDMFGTSLAAGRFNDDAIQDLAVGIPRKTVNGKEDAGMVAILHGSSDGLFPTHSQTLDQQVLPDVTESSGDRFGETLAAGNFDGDAFSDLAIGAPRENLSDGRTDSGQVAVVFGSRTGLTAASNEILTVRDTASRNGTSERFGYALASGDVDDDGVADLVIGAPYHDVDSNDSGAVFVFNGDSDRQFRRNEVLSQRSFDGGSNQAGANFGSAVLARDLDGDGKAELIASAPTLDVAGVTDAGRVWAKSLPEFQSDIEAEAGIVIDRDTGRIIRAKNANYRLHIASTTKIMTGVLAAEALDRGDITTNQIITISQHAEDAGGSGIDLRQGDKISFQDLLTSLMLPSTNTSGVAIGEALAGSEAAWVTRMNNRAASLGLNDTHFHNAHGRDPGDVDATCTTSVFDTSRCAHYSTPADLARLARTALNNARFAGVVRSENRWTTTWTRSGADVDVELCNTNSFLRSGAGSCSASANYDARFYGVKTGTTDLAGACLVGGFADSGNDYITVVLDANDDRYDSTRTVMAEGIAAH